MIKKQYTLGSLFDGIGGFPYAASFFDIKPIWASEILPQAISVTKRHFPEMEHLGDLTAIDGGKIKPVDIITFGSPCQDLSVAGRRAGLDGERSGLFNEAIRIIDEMRRATNGKYPRYAIWENVPVLYQAPKGVTLKPCLKRSAKPKFPCLYRENGQMQEWLEATELTSLGFCTTPNISECHSDAGVSFLSAILEARVPLKYSLSPKACRGILRRAEKRGKKLPQMLKVALDLQAGLQATTT